MKEIALKVHQRKLIKYFKQNTINLTDSENEANFPKEWQKILTTLGCFKTVVDGSLNDKTDLKVLQGLMNKKDLIKLNKGAKDFLLKDTWKKIMDGYKNTNV